MSSETSRTFEVRHCLGRGGFGEVYQATMRTSGGLESEVALKVLRRDVNPSSDAVQRLRDEGKLLARLGHPAILNVYDLCVLEGRVTLVTEYVAGEDLTALMGRGEQIGLRALLEVIGAVAQALDAAWNTILPDGRALKLVHRDIKPSNIRIGRHGEVKLLDFGIARTDTVDREARTQTDMMVGSPLYMAPERFLTPDLDPAADVWSLGAILYEALHRRRFYGRMDLPRIAGMAMERARYEEYLAERFKDDAPSESARAVELARSVLQYDPRKRPTASEFSAAAEILADTLDEIPLSRWCRTRDWRAERTEQAEMSGRVLSEGTLARPKPKPAELPTPVAAPPPAPPTVPRRRLALWGVALVLSLGVLVGGASILSAGLGAAAMRWTTPGGPTTPTEAAPTDAPDEPPSPQPAAPEPQPPTAPEPKPEPEPALQPAPAPRPRPAPAPQPAPQPSPDPAPGGTPEPAPTPAPSASTGHVVLSGARSAEVIGPDGPLVLPADAPAGSWDVHVAFDEGPAVRVGTVQVTAGGTHTVNCNARFRHCSID